MNIKAGLLSNRSLILMIFYVLGYFNLSAQNMTWRPVGLNRMMSGVYNDGDSVLLLMGNYNDYNGSVSTQFMVKMKQNETIEYFDHSYPFSFPWVACHYKGELYAGGWGLFKLTGNNWQLLDSANMVNVLKVIDGKLIIGGLFTDTTEILGKKSSCLVAYDGVNFENYHNLDTINYYVAVRAIEQYKGKLYVGGNFDPFPPYNTDMKEIVRWNGSNWESVGQGIKGGGSDIVNSMAVMDDTLYVAGMMQQSVGGPGNGIAQYDGTNWHNMGNGVNNWNNVNGIAVIDDILYITGNFSDAGGKPSSSFAAYKNGEWCTNDVPFDRVTNGVVKFNGKIYVWGNFWTINGDSSKSLAELTGTPGCFKTLSTSKISKTKKEYEVFPNPASVFTFRWLQSIYPNARFKVMDVTGKILLEQQANQSQWQVNASAWPKGVYWLQVATDEKTITEKLLKE